jgi:hypothetical protein
MSQPRNMQEVKERFGAGAATLEFNELKDEKGIRVGIRPSGGKFIERHTWTSLNDIVRNMGGQYGKEEKCWIIPIPQSSLPTPTSVQKPPVTSPSVDPNERKFAVENLARVLDAVPENPSWVEEALATVARGVLILLEEKRS